MIKDIKRGIGWIDPEYVGDSWENSSDAIDFSIVKAEIFKRLMDAGVLYFSDESGEEKGKAVKSSDLPSIMKMYESFNEGAMSDIDIIAQEAKDFKSFVKEFKKEYKNMDAGSPKELEAWLQTIYDSAKENMDESIVTEAKDVKSEAISRLADFFRVSPSSLQKFKFDGKDSIKDLTNALNATSYEGAEAYYKVAIEMAKKDLGIDESLLTEKDEAVFIEFLNKDKNFKKDTKHFKSYDEAVKWAKANFDKFSPDMIKYESLEINEKNEVTVSLRYAVQANDIFDDMYRKLGEKESTDVFSFKSKEYAEDFIESLIMVGVPKKEIN
jgi:hypothetical protein